jgi:hypothetical protein
MLLLSFGCIPCYFQLAPIIEHDAPIPTVTAAARHGFDVRCIECRNDVMDTIVDAAHTASAGHEHLTGI